MLNRQEIEDRMNATRGYFYTSPMEALKEFEQMLREEAAAADEDAAIVTSLPTKWEICDTCHGNGTQALHGMVVSGDLLDDPEFMEGYMRGVYDTACEAGCEHGKVRVPDYDAMGPELRQRLEEYLEGNAQSNAESLAEYRMGA